MVGTDAPGSEQARSHLELSLGGMTCASCAARIEKRLNRLDGVTATVNYATERARVDFPRGMDPAELVATVESAGYTAAAPGAPSMAREPASARLVEVDPTQAIRTRLVISALLSVPVLVMAMVPALQFDHWQWASLTLAAPVVVWGAWPFHRAAWANLRHGAASMDTLISVGTLAAFGWSLWALFVGEAGMNDMRMAFSIRPERGMGSSQIYLEVAAGVTVFILAGRYFEARAKRRSGAALEALLELGAKDVTVLRDEVETRVPV